MEWLNDNNLLISIARFSQFLLPVSIQLKYEGRLLWKVKAFRLIGSLDELGMQLIKPLEKPKWSIGVYQKAAKKPSSI